MNHLTHPVGPVDSNLDELDGVLVKFVGVLSLQQRQMARYCPKRLLQVVGRRVPKLLEFFV